MTPQLRARIYVHWVGRLSHVVRKDPLDLLIACVAAQVALGIGLGRDSADAPQAPLWVSIPAAVLVVLPLFARRRYPFGAPVTVWILAAAASFVDGRAMVFAAGTSVAGMIAAFLLGNLADARRARFGLVLVVGSAATVAYNDPSHAAGDVVFAPVLFGLIWIVGYALRERAVQAASAEQRAAQMEREGEERERRVIAEERARLAREMHDVVGHGVSVMTVQAAAVRRRLTPEQSREREALLAVEQTGREALAEMRRLVGVLREAPNAPELAPPPGLGQVPKLLTQVRETGLPVDLTIEGDPVRLPAGVDLTAYRVVQEGLTNAIKHAHARRAEVHVRYAPDRVEVEVHDDGDGAGAGGGGHGLVGMRERIAVYDGELEAGPCAEGGYRVRASLPVRA
jgi:signal transduction histidine kinase